jgi:hypothetical protein
MKRIFQLIAGSILSLLPLGLMESCESGVGGDQTDGQMMFWSDFDGAPIDVYVDSKYQGTIEQFFAATPDCGSDGCVTVNLPPDTYSFHAEEQQGPGSSGQTWNGNITVRINSCGALNLTASKNGIMLIASETNCSAGIKLN